MRFAFVELSRADATVVGQVFDLTGIIFAPRTRLEWWEEGQVTDLTYDA
jgi:hypothetical protein